MADRSSAAIVGIQVWRHAYDIEPDDAVRSAVRLLIMQAIAKTPTLCMACGRPGTGQQNTDAHLVCCDEHGELLGRRPADFLALVHPGVQQARSVPAHCGTPCAASQAGSRRCAPEP